MPALKQLPPVFRQTNNTCHESQIRFQDAFLFPLKSLYLLAILIVSTAHFTMAAGESPTNILILLADDLGYADIGVNGCTDFGTPNIDSIAQNGIRFTNGYVAAPVCSPSRAGLISGRYPTHFGYEFNHIKADLAPFGLPPSIKTAARWFKDAGYFTGHIGKWHLGTMQRQEFRPENRGFDESVWFPGQDKLPPLFYFRHNREGATGNPGHDPGIERTAKFFFDKADSKFQEAERTDDKYVDIAMGHEARQFIEKNRNHPWFLYVAFLSPHTPLMPPVGTENPSIQDEQRRKCAAMTTLLDSGVGDILKTLRDTGQEDHTLIVFLSDNGAVSDNGSRNTPLKGYKGTLWEGGIREPFVMQWKGGGIPAGQVVDAPVSSLDILPTALAAAGVNLPAHNDLDGVNLLPFLTGKTKEIPHTALFWRYGEQMAVREGDWKLVRTIEGNKNQAPLKTRLYNLNQDIGEKTDLSGEEPEKTAELQEKWNAWNAKNIKALWEYDSPGETEKTTR